MRKFFWKKEKGFTLIELLVVIAIIAILSIIGLVAYGNFLKNSRDSKRQADLKIIQSALEDYHADQLFYPSSLSVLTSGSRIYLNQVLSDPKPPPNYSYAPSPSGCSGSTCSGYCLYAQMEATTLTSDSTCTTLPLGFTSPKAYGVTRP